MIRLLFHYGKGLEVKIKLVIEKTALRDRLAFVSINFLDIMGHVYCIMIVLLLMK